MPVSPDPSDAAANGAAKPKRNSPPAPSVAAHIKSRYLVQNDRYHFPDQQAAFVDHGARFTVQSRNAQVLKDLIAIAQARGWSGIQVSGTEEFRRAAWAAANAAGLEVKGYTPTSLERQAAERSLRRAEAKKTESVRPPRTPQPSAEPESSSSSTARTRSQAAAEAIRSAATTREELQLKFPEVSEVLFKRLDSHEEFANAFVRAGLVREADRQQVIEFMRERLAAQVATGKAVATPDSRRVKSLISRAVEQVRADLGLQPAPPVQSFVGRAVEPREQGRGGR